MTDNDSALAAQPTTERRRGRAPQGLTLAIAGFLPILSILSLAPAIPSILEHFADVPMAQLLVPLMVTAPGLMVALFAPFAGFLADRYGRRRLILVATFFYGFAGLAPFLLKDLTAMFVSRLAVGITETFILVIVNALYADYFDIKARRTWITVQGVSGPILGTASIALAGALTTWTWNGAFVIYSIAFVIFFAMLFFFFEPDRVKQDASAKLPASPFPVRTAITFSLVTLFASTVYYVFIVQSGLAFDAIGVKNAGDLGMLIGLASLGTPVGAVIFNILSRRISAGLLIATFLSVMGIGMIGMGSANTSHTMLAFGFVQQIGAGITVTALIFWVSQLLAPEHRGKGFGFWSSAFFAGQFVSPLVFGAVRTGTGDILPTFVAIGAVALVGATASVIFSSRLPKPAPSA